MRRVRAEGSGASWRTRADAGRLTCASTFAQGALIVAPMSLGGVEEHRAG